MLITHAAQVMPNAAWEVESGAYTFNPHRYAQCRAAPALKVTGHRTLGLHAAAAPAPPLHQMKVVGQ